MLKWFHIQMSWYSVGLTSHIPMTAAAAAGAATSVPDMAVAGAGRPKVDGRHRLTMTQDRHRGRAALRGRGSTMLIRFSSYREDGHSRVIACEQRRHAAIRRGLSWRAPCHLPGPSGPSELPGPTKGLELVRPREASRAMVKQSTRRTRGDDNTACRADPLTDTPLFRYVSWSSSCGLISPLCETSFPPIQKTWRDQSFSLSAQPSWCLLQPTWSLHVCRGQ